MPDVSVVMSVFNGGDCLVESVESVLTQEDVDLELIAVNDGSTDDSGTLLDDYAGRDERVRVIHQPKGGLTRGLIRGCAEARGAYIARQDAGDLSLPGRLRVQLDAFRGRIDVVLVSCGARFVGPHGEELYDVVVPDDRAMTGLLSLNVEELWGPAHHGSTMFRADAFRRVGGYREEFHFAQDLDLWIRLAELGSHIAMAWILYQAQVKPESLSGLYRREQLRMARIVLDCARLRRAGLSEAEALARARTITPTRGAGRAARARALYFIGTCLRARRDPRALRYFREGLRTWPFHPKLAWRWLLR